MDKTQNDILDVLTSNFTYISKYDAIKYIVDLYGNTNVSIKDIVCVYKSIDW